MLKVYGSILCPDCTACREAMDKAGIAYEYFDFSEDLRNLKTFLSLRDTEAIFSEVKADGKIGIPCMLLEDGTVTLDWEGYVGQAKA